MDNARHKRLILAVPAVASLVASMLVWAAVDPAGAQTAYTVTSTVDGAAGSLRDVLDQANTDGTDSEIDLPAGATLDLDLCGASGVDENANASGDLDYTENNDLTIFGNGATIRQTCAEQRVLHALTGDDVSIWETTITGGAVTVGVGGGNGGGIYLQGEGDLLLAMSTVSGNSAGNVGGGVAAGDTGFFTQTTVIDSTISGNTASGASGGAIFTLGENLVINSTISGNTAGRSSGAIVGDTELIYATIFGNGVVTAGGGAQLDIGNLVTFGSVIAGGFGASQECITSSTVSGGWNADSDGSCDLTDPTDQSGIDPQLGPLADNGGPTQTHLPAAGSPLLDTIPAGSCDTTYVADQRNVSRPQGSACDTGSVEVVVQAPTTTTTTTTTVPESPGAEPTGATPTFTG